MCGRIATSLVLLALIAALAGCGSTDTSTPVACLEGGGAYLRALQGAPGTVTLDDGTPISGCLVENQSGGELATVGTALVAATTKLNAEARKRPGGAANLELGYLLGAAERGAKQTNGIHVELIRRLTAAARYSPDDRPLPPVFMRTYREGFSAGEARG
jgi:hypothetical protein